MAWTFTNDAGAYETAVGMLLRSDCERNTISVTVLDNATRREAPLDPPELYAWWTNDQGQVTGCASITPPWPVLLDQVPEAALRPLAAALLAEGVKVPGVNAPHALAATFAAIWCSLTNDRAVLGMATRLFRLEALTQPDRSVSGAPRRADESDRALLIDWYTRFGQEIHGPMPRVEESVQQRLADGALWLWADESGLPTSLVGHTQPVEGVVRVGPVFTPREQRRRGYAEVLTHQVSQHLSQQGRKAVLFTDLANPTSNGIYTRVGYRPVMDRMMLAFEPSSANS
jgi:hypothetical protein